MADEIDREFQHVFFISRIGDPDTAIRFQSDLVLKEIAEPAAKRAGFAGAIRADDMNYPGRITDRVIEQIAEGPAVIADLTGRNPNVYYEVVLAHAARRPLVQLIEETERGSIPFDITDQNTIVYSATDLRSYELAATRASSQLETTLGDPNAVDNPVTTALRFAGLRRIEPEAGSDLATVMQYLRRLDDRMGSLEGRAIRTINVPAPQSKVDDAISQSVTVMIGPTAFNYAGGNLMLVFGPSAHGVEIHEAASPDRTPVITDYFQGEEPWVHMFRPNLIAGTDYLVSPIYLSTDGQREFK